MIKTELSPFCSSFWNKSYKQWLSTATNNTKREIQALCASWQKYPILHMIYSCKILSLNLVKPLYQNNSYRKSRAEKAITKVRIDTFHQKRQTSAYQKTSTRKLMRKPQTRRKYSLNMYLTKNEQILIFI